MAALALAEGCPGLRVADFAYTGLTEVALNALKVRYPKVDWLDR